MKKKLFESIWMRHLINTSYFLIDLNEEATVEKNPSHFLKKYTTLFPPKELCLLINLCHFFFTFHKKLKTFRSLKRHDNMIFYDQTNESIVNSVDAL